MSYLRIFLCMAGNVRNPIIHIIGLSVSYPIHAWCFGSTLVRMDLNLYLIPGKTYKGPLEAIEKGPFLLYGILQHLGVSGQSYLSPSDAQVRNKGSFAEYCRHVGHTKSSVPFLMKSASSTLFLGGMIEIWSISR